MTELDIWATFGANQSAAGSHFIAIAFLVWVGLRVSNNIRNSDEANIVMKLAGTGFCLSVAYFVPLIRVGTNGMLMARQQHLAI